MVRFAFVALLFVAVAAAQFASWPNPSSTTKVPKKIVVKAGETYDGKNGRFTAGFANGDGGQGEGQDPIFELQAGAKIVNVVLGAPAADGIHCLGGCTIENVWWEDVGEDAATFKGSSSDKYTVTGGGAKKADDKVFQHNGGGTLTITNFQAQDIGKLYRSCGNCKNNGFDRHVVIDTVKLSGATKVIAGVNGNYKDSATLRNIQIAGTVKTVCENFEGTNNNHQEPKSVHKYTSNENGDGKVCVYKTSDIKA
uniref:Probable pectate lyase F n=1 Tax=Bursaphelenchus mucronatus TaxID=6325 RepID=Q33CQ1_BURMU|nr:pectate lyase [Bursaphelenchus mucronatus]BAE48374.1 pectate lyase [Bursaphelenchus mucronatus]